MRIVLAQAVVAVFGFAISGVGGAIVTRQGVEVVSGLEPGDTVVTVN
jgi:hypothetical protein